MLASYLKVFVLSTSLQLALRPVLCFLLDVQIPCLESLMTRFGILQVTSDVYAGVGTSMLEALHN